MCNLSLLSIHLFPPPKATDLISLLSLETSTHFSRVQYNQNYAPCSFLCLTFSLSIQAHLALQYFTLLCFTDTVAFTSWINLLVPFFQHLLTLCLCITFWLFSRYFNVLLFVIIILIIMFFMEICNLWCYYYKKITTH